jgi:hypothetical protein
MSADFEEKIKYWEQLRNAIVHEDNLVHHRLTWLLTIEGFLVSAFFLVQSAALADKLTSVTTICVETVLGVVFILSLWFCLIAGSMVTAAYEQIALIQMAWTKRYANEHHPERRIGLFGSTLVSASDSDAAATTVAEPEFPPIMGGFCYSRLLNTRHIPYIFFFFNIFLIIGCIIVGIENQLPKQERLMVDVEKSVPGLKVKATFDGKPTEQLPPDVKSLLHSP